MNEDRSLPSGISLTRTKGFPLYQGGARSSMLRRWFATAIVAAASLVAAFGLLTAAQGVPSAEVYAHEAGAVVNVGTVVDVLPGGPAWRLDMRPGDVVVALDPGQPQADWRITVRHPDGHSVSVSEVAMIDALRGTAPVALLAVILVVLAALLLRVDLRLSAAAAAITVVLAERPLMAGADPAISSAAAAMALAVPAAWLGLRGRGRRLWLALVPLAAAAGLAVAWLAVRFSQPAAFEAAEAARVVTTFGLLLVVVSLVVRDAFRLAVAGYDARRISDPGVLAAALALGGLVLLTGAPYLVVILVAALSLAFYPPTRTRLSGALDRLVLGNLREQASIQAVEDERGRLARELHDQPLQELTAVIRRLDEREGLAAEATILRDVADHLRSVMVELRTPVLEDLGLVPALAFAADEADRQSRARVSVEVIDDCEPGSGPRPPADVELATFRIVQEALNNALRHSGASRVVVSGHVSGDAIDLLVTDDGVGIDSIAVRQAGSRGRMGLRSMTQRAALIEAHLSVEAGDPGTRVRLRWPA